MTQHQENDYAIDVQVKTQYIASQSEPDRNRFVFAYHIVITNKGNIGAQLLTRRWLITNGEGVTQEVNGPGVVGQQPLLEPDQQHSYSSGTVLSTSVGSMQGHFGMKASDGHEFIAPITPFTLAYPGALH